jgi:hypothetical protein
MMQRESVIVRSGWRGQNINGWRMDFGERAKDQTCVDHLYFLNQTRTTQGGILIVFENARKARIS